MSKLSELIEEQRKLREKFKAEGKDAIHAALQEVLDAHPKLQSFSWRQYAPYFNDGEACVFGVHEISETVTFDGREVETYSSYEGYGKNKTVTNPELYAAYVALGALSSQLRSAEDILEAVFGDDCKVTVTRDGITTDSCDHD